MPGGTMRAIDLFPSMTTGPVQANAPFEFHPHPADVPPRAPNTCMTYAAWIGGVLVLFVACAAGVLVLAG